MAIAAAIDACPKDVFTVSVKQGSVILSVSLPAEGAGKSVAFAGGAGKTANASGANQTSRYLRGKRKYVTARRT